MFSDVKFDHLLGFMHLLWVRAQRFIKSSLRWTERHLETGTMYARAVALAYANLLSPLQACQVVQRWGTSSWGLSNARHRRRRYFQVECGLDVLDAACPVWSSFEDPKLGRDFDRARVPCESMAVSSPGVARCPTGKAGRCIRLILMAGVQEKQQQIRSQVLLGVQELQKPKTNPDLRRKQSGVVLPS